MKRSGLSGFIQLLVMALFVCASAQGLDWHFPVGVSYLTQFRGEVGNLHESNQLAEGLERDPNFWPFGLSFQPYVEFDHGIGVGGCLGPPAFINVFDHDERSFSDIPIGLDLRYTPFYEGDFSPYVRAGMRYHLASGDYVDRSTPGAFTAVGLEIGRKGKVGLGLEASYDCSEIDIEEHKMPGPGGTLESPTIKKTKPHELNVTIFVLL